MTLAWRASGAIFGRPRGLWKTDSSPNRCTQNLTHSATQGRSSHLIEACVRPPADLVEPPGETGGTAGHPGDTDTGSSHLGNSFYYLDAGADKSHFGIFPPPSLLASGPRPAHVHQTVGTNTGQATNWAGTQPHPPAESLP